MSILPDDLINRFIAQLTEDELRGSVVYAVEQRLPAGTQVQFPGTSISIKTDSYLGFIDREPGANWGHPARYVIVSLDDTKSSSVNARMPPFGCEIDLNWCVIFQAPSVSEAAVEQSVTQHLIRKEE